LIIFIDVVTGRGLHILITLCPHNCKSSPEVSTNTKTTNIVGFEVLMVMTLRVLSPGK
jgi:hypothetical protein